MNALPSAAVLRAGGSAFVLDLSGPRPPRVLHWGADLGELTNAEVKTLAVGRQLGRGHSAFDKPVPPSITRDSSEGFFGIPGVSGHRLGTDFSNKFELTSVSVDDASVVIGCTDAAAGLRLQVVYQMAPSGVLKIQSTLTNIGNSDYVLHELTQALPLPSKATQLTDFTGNWSREFHPQTHEIEVGVWSREIREGRTGHDFTLTFNAHTSGANFQTGELWSVSLGWSGNTRHYVERLPDGTKWIGANELLLPGEVILQSGQSYEAPVLYATYSSAGFDESAAQFHTYLRARNQHPKTPRPLTINVWEAVYMDHNFEKLSALADVAAEIGVERFVLDDGWFGSRRDDTSGLGDWIVSAAAWPEGLHPLAKKLESVGIEFGLWFEPEMIQLDSDVYRAHPEWVLAVPGRLPADWRSQQVIDLANPEAFAHVLEQMDAVLTEYPTIRYLKWDHNRPVVDAAHAGHPAIRLQTQAVYRLFDELKSRHAGLEIESCSSGGGRIDLGILEHTDRVWVSDSNDALERQRMQRWTTQVLPPELMGTHIGPHHSHTSGRTHALTFRAITALFGHAGLEWDITETTPAERIVLRSWAEYYKANRGLLHAGRVVRVDTHEPTMSLHGVVAHDKSRAIFAVVQEGVTAASRPQPLHFPGLDPNRRYRVTEVRPAGDPHYWQIEPTPWIANPVELSGQVLAEVGLTAPILTSEQATLLEFWAL